MSILLQSTTTTMRLLLWYSCIVWHLAVGSLVLGGLTAHSWQMADDRWQQWQCGSWQLGAGSAADHRLLIIGPSSYASYVCAMRFCISICKYVQTIVGIWQSGHSGSGQLAVGSWQLAVPLTAD